MDRQPAVYNFASSRNGTLYVGVTSNLLSRIWQHRNDLVQGLAGVQNGCGKPGSRPPPG